MREIIVHREDYYSGTMPINVTSDLKESDENHWTWRGTVRLAEQTRRNITIESVQVFDGESTTSQYWLTFGWAGGPRHAQTGHDF